MKAASTAQYDNCCCFDCWNCTHKIQCHSVNDSACAHDRRSQGMLC